MENPLADLAANVWTLVPYPAVTDAPAPSPWLSVLFLAVAALAVLPGLAALARSGAETLRRFARRTTRPAFFGGLVFAAVLCCQADKFPTNPVQSVVEGLSGLLPGQSVVFSPEDGTDELARSAVLPAGGGGGEAVAQNPQPLLTDANRVSGLALVSASPAAPGWDVPPGGAEPFGPWAECGAHLDFLGLLLTNARPDRCAWEAAGTPPFPVGTNLHGRLFASVCGAVSFGAPYRLWPDAAPVPDGGAAPLFAPLKGPLGLAPPQGAFWLATTPSNTLLLTWRDVYLDRDSNLAASAQCELAPSGDFAFRVKLPQNGGEGFVTGVQNNGGGESVLWDSNLLALARSPGGVEIRGRGFGLLPTGVPDDADTDCDGLGDADEVFSAGTSPLLADTDGDGLRDGEDPSPLNPDADGDLAADSLDPVPLAYSDPAALPGCCSNAWLFHVHNGLPSGGTGCPLAADPLFFAADPLLFPATVTLDAAVPPPGAVLWVGKVPLVMRDPGSWTLWLDKTTNQAVRLCAPRGSAVDYAVTSADPGFLFQRAPPAPPEGAPLPLVSRAEGAVAAPFLKVEPVVACFHGSPVTFRAAGCAAGLTGLYAWTYGGVTVVTNVPVFTAGPDFGGLPPDVSVSFMPDGLDAGASAPAGGPGPRAAGAGVLSAGCGWPATSGSGCGYCRRHWGPETFSWETWFCELSGGPAPEGSCPALKGGYIPPADGTNTFFTLPVPRRPGAWPEGCASFRPWPVGFAGQGEPPPPPTDPEDCGHGNGCNSCAWAGDHWHRWGQTSRLLDHSGCCAYPEHNPDGGAGSAGAEPVVYQGASGLAVAFMPFEGGGPFPLAGGPLPDGGVVSVTGLTPSASPHDRFARFTCYVPSVPATYYEVDRFTVMSLDLQPDVDGDGAIGSGDASALAADWDRLWTIPAGTNVWFPVKIFNDVALPGAYTLAVSGSSNVVARYGAVVVRGGGNAAVSFPTGSTEETVEVQAESPGNAVMTVSFAGSGALTNYTCEIAVDINAWGLDIDVDSDNDGAIDTGDGDEDGYEEYAPGLLLTVTNGLAEGAGMRYSVRLSADLCGFTGTVRLAQSAGCGQVRVWTNTEPGAASFSLPMEWDLSQGETPPAHVWVDGTATGAVSLAYSAIRNGQVLTGDRVRLTVIPPASFAPDGGSFAVIWAPLFTMYNANDENNLGWSDGTKLADEIAMQGFTNVVWYKDMTGDADLNLGDCTYENYLNMRNSGAVCVTASHGDFGTHLAVYAPYTPEGEALIENWCTNNSGMSCQEQRPNPNDPLKPGYYFAEVSSTWLSANWKTSLDARRAIISWNICRSATGTATLPSVKEAAGGRWRIGYVDTTTGFEGSCVNQTFFRYMNGKNGEGLRRTSGLAYGDGSEYPENVRMSGNPWTTLAPAHISANAWMPISLFPLPGSSASFGKGWGCVIFDTYLNDTASAASAIQQLSGSTISDIRWVQLGTGKRAIGFKYDKSGGECIELRLAPDGIRNFGSSGGRPIVKRDDSWSSGYLDWGF